MVGSYCQEGEPAKTRQREEASLSIFLVTIVRQGIAIPLLVSTEEYQSRIRSVCGVVEIWASGGKEALRERRLAGWRVLGVGLSVCPKGGRARSFDRNRARQER